MSRYVLKRLLTLIPIVMGITFIVYGLMSLAPGDPGTAVLGATATDEEIAAYNHKVGFDRPFLVKYFDFLYNMVFKLDFGRMKSLTNVYLTEELQKKELKSVGKPVIRVAYNNNIVSVFLEKSEYSEAELEKIAAGLRRKKKYIMLDGDRIIDLDSEAARDLGDAIQDFGMDPKDLYKKKKVSFSFLA